MSAEWTLVSVVVLFGALSVHGLSRIAQHLLEIKRLLAFQMNQRVD